MSQKLIFATVFAMFALSHSLAGPGLKNGLNKGCYECDSNPELFEFVNYYLQRGFTQHYNNYCGVAQVVADGLRAFPGGEWIVLIGAHGLMAKKEVFAAQFDRVPNTFILTSYNAPNNKQHDVLVVKPLCEKPNKIVKDNGVPVRAMEDIKTDMPLGLEIKLTVEFNQIFSETNAHYNNTAYQALKFVKETCGGKFFVMVGPEMALDNSDELCGVANKLKGYNYNATYNHRDSIHLFSPVCN